MEEKLNYHITMRLDRPSTKVLSLSINMKDSKREFLKCKTSASQFHISKNCQVPKN